MTVIYGAISLWVVVAIFLVINRRRGVFIALGASLLALVILGVGYMAVAAIIVRSM